MTLYRRILMATDFSPASESAFHEAARLARETGAALTVLHVYHPPTLAAFPYPTPELHRQVDRGARDQAATRLAPWIRRASERGIAATPLLESGVEDIEIVQAAVREHADLIVLGTHGRHGPSRLLLGSVASRVVADAPCPVLTIRAERAAERIASCPDAREES